MAKSSSPWALHPLIAALGFLSFLGVVCGEITLLVQGNLYCDTCRASFVTPASTSVAGAKVKLTCRDRITQDVTYTQEGESDNSGAYKLPVDGDHEEEICEVKLVSSPDEGCNEIAPGLDTARVVITENNGMVQQVRYANSLGFLKAKPLKECPEILKAMGVPPKTIPTKTK